MTPKTIFRFIVALIVCEGAGLIGSLFTAPAINGWYATLTKPSFNPPSWIFAPVWTLLYLLMALSLTLIWNSDHYSKRKAILLFIFQLIINAVWSIIFFGLQNPTLALVDIVVLLVALIAVMVQFARIRRGAMIILIPYLAWVSFATVLNLSIVILNQ